MVEITHPSKAYKLMKPRKVKKRSVLLIDANNMAWRAFYAIRGLKAHDELPTGVIYGVLQSLRTLVDIYSPRRVFMVWDKRGKTWRHKFVERLIKKGIYERGYKSGRKKDPEIMDEFLPQVEALQSEIIPLLGYFQYIGHEQGGELYEADDVIGSLAYQSAAREYIDRVIIVSTDNDYLQLLEEPKIRIARPDKKHLDDYRLRGRKWLLREYGVKKPRRMISIGAIMGDSTDNIEGIDGIGPVTAAKIIKKYHTLKKLYQRLKKDSIILTSVVTKKLRGTKTKVKANYKLKSIVTSLEIDSIRVKSDLHRLKVLLKEKYEIESISPYSLKKLNMDTDFNMI